MIRSWPSPFHHRQPRIGSFRLPCLGISLANNLIPDESQIRHEMIVGQTIGTLANHGTDPTLHKDTGRNV